ncbi:YabG peptidase U57 [Geobacillus sp. BCO2]|nr:YabG peptidase U57 [Geobacillus sp. BCO2]
MDVIKIGDIVARKSYQCDVLFRVIDMKEKTASGKRFCMVKMCASSRTLRAAI